MKRNIWTKMLIWQLVLCILIPTLPLEWTQGLLSSLNARAEAAVAAENVESSFMELVDRATDMEVLEDGEWRYAVIAPLNYAVVLGHADASVRELTVPDLLGGADVVGLAAGALSDHAALESVSLPGNVNAVAKGAIPAGTLVRGYHGTYAHTYALGNGYAFQSRSEYDFAQGVIDYADVRTDAFVRHSAFSLSMRKLEAARLREGSVFFLVDPNNAYQISYYRVLSLEEQADGFVSVRCETPIMDEVMRSFSGQNEVMKLDPSTLVLGEGVSYVETRAGGVIDEVSLPLNINFPLENVNVSVVGLYEVGFVAVDYEGAEDTKKSATMEQTERIEMTVTVEQKNGLSPETAFKGQMDSIQKIASRANDLAKTFDGSVSTPYKHPLGMGYVFSYAGIVTLQAQFNLDFEIKGSGTFVYRSETVTTYHGDTDGNTTKSTVVVNDHITGSAQIKGRVGVRAEANLYLYCICVFQVSGFVGLEAELKWEIVKYDLNAKKGSGFDRAVNMMDCLTLEVRFLVEVGIRAGVLKVFNIELPLEISVGATFKLVNKKLIDKHLHMMPNVIHAELLTGDLSFGGAKDQEHNSAQCPYGKSSLEVRLSIPVEKQKALYMQFDYLDPGFTINEPEDPTLAYDDYKLTYWHSSSKPTEANRVTFPYTITEGENLLYGRVLKKYYIHFIYEDGTEVTEPAYLFPGDTFTLPQTERNTIKWLRVQSPYNITEHAEQLEAENGVYTVPFGPTAIYMCAFEAPEIEVTFYESVDGGMMYETGTVVSKAGQTVEAPETTMAEHYEDAGWQIVGGEEITMPYTIPVMQTEPIKIVHFLGIKPAEDDYTWISGTYPSPGSGQSDHLTYDWSGVIDGNRVAVITGRDEYWTDDDGVDHYSPTVNLVIPSTIDGYPVVGIAIEAFKDKTSLVTVTLPSTVNYVGANAFQNCTSLRKVDASAHNSSLYINESAFEGCTSLTDFAVGSSAFVHYKTRSFYESGIVNAPKIASVEKYAFTHSRNLQRAELLSSCTSIPEGAFLDCPQLREIEIPASVKSIGGSAFAGCSSLLEMELPYGIDSYGKNIFYGCTSLKKLIVHGGGADTYFDLFAPALEYLEIGEGFTEIEASLYKNIRTLQTAILPDSLEIIGDYAFYGTSVSEFNLSDNMQSVGAYAFAENPFLSSIDLTCMQLGESAFMNCPLLASATLDGMSIIPGSAFDGCVSLAEISIPAVTEIGERAFYNCPFEEITLYEGLETIGKEAFYSCQNLQSFTAPSTLATISEKAFYECESLASPALNEGLAFIYGSAFAYCTSIEEMIIPDSVQHVYANIIFGCTSLKTLYVGADGMQNASFSIGEGNSLEYVEFGEGILEVSSDLFDAYCINVETMIFPSTMVEIRGKFETFGLREVIIRGDIKTIGSNVFANCPYLETVIVEGEGATIYPYAFAYTPELHTVSLNGVATMNDYAFLQSAVESVVIGEGILKIGNYAFMDCVQLESFSAANTLTNIGSASLYNCPSLEELRIGGKLSFMMFTDPGGRDLVRPNLRVLEIGEGVTVIPEDVFAGMLSEIEVLTLPDTLVEIQRWAFEGLGENIKELKLPESLEIISFAAFENSHLEKVELPASVTEVRSGAFESSKNLKSVTIHGENVVIGDYAFQNCSALEEVIIRGSIKSIGYDAFRSCSLKEITLPAGIERIGNYAFAENLNLISFTLQGAAALGNGVLSDCDNLEYLYVGGVETITSNMFNYPGGLPGLRRLVIGEGVKTIGSKAFAASTYSGSVIDYSLLETVSLPASLEKIQSNAFYHSGIRELVYTGGNLNSIGTYAFSSCERLETVILDGADVAIGNYAFSYCDALQTVQLGSGVKSIGASAFSYSALREVTLAEGIESIGNYAFMDNINLKTIAFPDSITTYGMEIFRNSNNLERLHIGGGADLSKTPGSSLLYLYKGMRHVVVAEGPTELATNAILRSSNVLETVTLPESMTVINADNLYDCRIAKWVKLSSSVTSIVNDGDSYSAPYILTLVTDTYNEVVAQYAAETGAAYLPLDGEVPEYEVQFFLSVDGAAGAEPVSSCTASLLSGLTLPEAPAQEGYRFTGWYYDAACTVPVLDGASVAGDMTLYAGYIPNDVTLFALRLPPFAEVDGAEESALVPEGFVLYASQEQTDGTPTILPDAPYTEGYVFTGWHRDSLLYTPFEGTDGYSHPRMLYGAFDAAGQGGLTQANANGATITNYTLTESDSAFVTLPESIGGVNVTAIGAHAFKDLPITDLVIPAHVSEIDPQAFHGATQLSHLYVSGRNTHFTSVDGVLYNADKSILVRYPQGRRAVSFTVPETVVAIADRAFEDCIHLRSITLPEGLESIGAYAFTRTSLQEVTLPDSVNNLGAGAFANCLSLTEFVAHGLESIGKNALPGTPVLAVRGPIMDGELRRYILGNSPVNLIYNIRYLSIMESGAELAAYAVEAGAPLPAQAQGGTAGEGRIVYALYTDAALTQPFDASAVMPDEDLTLYADVRPVYEYEETTLETGETGLRLTAYNGNGGAVVLPQEISGKTVIALGASLMASARGTISSVTIGSGVISIADTALCGAGGEAYTGSILADAGSYAAQWAAQMGYPCEGSIYTLAFNTLGGARIAPMQAAAGALVRLPQPVRTDSVFGGWYLDEACTAAAVLDEAGLYCMPGSNVTLYALWTETGEALPFTYEESSEGITITGYTGADATPVIPSSINGLPVTAIAARAFLGHSFITSLTLPETLTAIGDNAFARMSALSAIVIPDSVRTIGYAAFRGCESLAQAHIGTGLETLGDQAFYGAKALKAFTAGDGGAFTVLNGVLYSGTTLVCAPAGMTGALAIPESVDTIAPYAMACSGIEEITFPATLYDIGEGALYDCDRLTDITFGDSSVPDLTIPSMFAAGADALKTVSLGSRVYAVGRGAFLNCTSLTQATIAAEVTIIGESAFAAAPKGFAITGARGSAAHAYASENGVLFRSTDGDDVTALVFDAESMELVLGQQASLNVTALPAMPEGEALRWTTSDEKIVVVSDGVIRCLSRGTAVITATAQNGVSASITVSVRGVPAETLALPADELFVPLNGQKTFEPILTPAWADTACHWAIDDEAIASVDGQGTVTGRTLGTTTIRVTTPSGLETSAALTVFIPTEEIILPENEMALTLNIIDSAQTQLHAAVYPENATFPAIEYASGDNGIVTVSESGLITVVGAGETTVTLTNTHTAGDPVVVTIPVTVEPYDLSGVPAPEIPPKSYNGYSDPADFDLIVGGRRLVEYTDYSIITDGSSEPGIHTATITGTGLFTGTITVSFEIVEKQAEIAYNGDTTFEEFSWYDIAWSITGNVDRYSVQQAFAPASDPTNWLTETPTEPGDYIMRLYVEDSYGVKGCELLINVRLVERFIRSVSFAADEIHVLAGQSFILLLNCDVEEGVELNYPSFSYSIEGTEGLIRVTSTSYRNGRIYPGINVAAGMEGTATLTATSDDYDSLAATVTVHVHSSAQEFSLPKVTEVHEEAFLGTQANIITLSSKKLSAGPRAFADSESLWQVMMPSGEATLSADMLEGSDAAVVMFTSMYADGIDHAIELGIPFAIED